jgi:hypothetical protein
VPTNSSIILCFHRADNITKGASTLEEVKKYSSAIPDLTERMNCLKCHHTYQVHEFNAGTAESILRVGKCLTPGCECRQYVDKIEKIDEDLL